MGKPLPAPPTGSSRPENRFPGGIAFFVLLLVSVVLWAALIAFVA